MPAESEVTQRSDDIYMVNFKVTLCPAGGTQSRKGTANTGHNTTESTMIRSFVRFDGVKPIAIGNQDLPPRGGYPEVVKYDEIPCKLYTHYLLLCLQINTRRGIGNRGPPGWAIWLGVCVMTVYGFYQVSA